MTTHKHRPLKTTEQCFVGAIPDAIKPDARAHGNVTQTDVCRCGASRQVNVNQGFREIGRWSK